MDYMTLEIIVNKIKKVKISEEVDKIIINYKIELLGWGKDTFLVEIKHKNIIPEIINNFERIGWYIDKDESDDIDYDCIDDTSYVLTFNNSKSMSKQEANIDSKLLTKNCWKSSWHDIFIGIVSPPTILIILFYAINKGNYHFIRHFDSIECFVRLKLGF
jgi:hypothetical protein